jgi:REP element-mobilizing transposase RayT
MPNSSHRALNGFSPRLAVTTKLTRCSLTSIVFHGIEGHTLTLAALARECKGCPETICKGCHETEHAFARVGLTHTSRFCLASVPDLEIRAQFRSVCLRRAQIAVVPRELKRYHESGQTHFITFTCFHRHPLLDSASARRTFELALEATRRSYRLCVYGYVVMPEHVHILLSEPERSNLAQAIKALKQGVSRPLIGGRKAFLAGRSRSPWREKPNQQTAPTPQIRLAQTTPQFRDGTGGATCTKTVLPTSRFGPLQHLRCHCAN